MLSNTTLNQSFLELDQQLDSLPLALHDVQQTL